TQVMARDRILSGRGMDAVMRDIWGAQEAMAAGDARAIERYGRLEDRLTAMGGYGAQAEAASIAANLGVPAGGLDRPLRSLSRRAAAAGGAGAHPLQRRHHAAAGRADQPP